jgi:asparagine synthase (glutamine-hydrolysing)
MEMDERIRWRLKAAGLKWLRAPKKYPYASYDAWFRGVLRSWAENILLSQRFLERGYFNPRYIRQLFDEHMAGQDHHQKLGALITIELWHQAFID